VLTAVALVVVLLVPAVVVAALMRLADARQRARDDVSARQIMLTDAIHAELGAVVSPVVQKRAFQPWRVVIELPQGRAREMARLIAITERVFGATLASSDRLHIVFTRPPHAPRAAAA
jgi:hypothetical protein